VTQPAQGPSASAPLPPRLQARLVEVFGRHQRGDLTTAERGYREILDQVPGCFDAVHLLGTVLIQRGAFEEGITRLREAIAIDGSQCNVRMSLARALLDTRVSRAALDCCDVLVGMQPKSAEVWFLRGNALQQLGAHAEAVDSYDRALAVQPNFPAALNNQGHSLRCLNAAARSLAAFERALALQPSYPLALNNRGLALMDIKRMPEALRSFDDALAIHPTFSEALANRGAALLAMKRFAEATHTFERLVRLSPDMGGAAGNLLYARRNCCDWREYEGLERRIVAAVERGELADLPLAFLCVTDSPQAQLACATTFAALKFPARPARAVTRSRHRHDRIRVAYLSGDFGDHAVSYSLAGVIEHHDVRRVETVGVGWGRQNEGPMRARLEAAFDRFIDATELSDSATVIRLRELEVDIAIDLMGHTAGQRTGIFAERCAPVQVNYLGYPGTSGAPFMDYIIADRCVIPEGDEPAYSECVVRLPCCYLPNDDRRRIASHPSTRAAADLPEAGFVFCAFNNLLKITPAIFDVWMRLLREVSGAVLWLRAGAPEARRNLEAAALQRGIDPSRLVFARPVESMEVHLARHRLADLFLDTVPYNGHSTVCDALWAGLPVLTCRGRSFAGRVGASLLRAANLAELIADNLDGYARLALAMAREPARLDGMRQRLSAQRSAGTLFNTAEYCRHFEAALTAMMDRHPRGLTAAPSKSLKAP
jgi:predicted O-linked N-acetylglucosamine transferase (SPINDLY family)